jgi:RES domain-containing protein
MSGDGAAIHGGRFNPKAMSALYLACDIVGAVREASQGFGARIDPLTICAYEVDCADVADLRSESACAKAGVAWRDLGCAWFALAHARREPPSWALAKRLIADGFAGVLVPSFAVGASAEDINLVQWRWGATLPHRVRVLDPSGRLPKNMLSWE